MLKISILAGLRRASVVALARAEKEERESRKASSVAFTAEKNAELAIRNAEADLKIAEAQRDAQESDRTAEAKQKLADAEERLAGAKREAKSARKRFEEAGANVREIRAGAFEIIASNVCTAAETGRTSEVQRQMTLIQGASKEGVELRAKFAEVVLIVDNEFRHNFTFPDVDAVSAKAMKVRAIERAGTELSEAKRKKEQAEKALAEVEREERAAAARLNTLVPGSVPPSDSPGSEDSDEGEAESDDEESEEMALETGEGFEELDPTAKIAALVDRNTKDVLTAAAKTMEIEVPSSADKAAIAGLIVDASVSEDSDEDEPESDDSEDEESEEEENDAGPPGF